jgi:hypothetical protein
MKLARLIIFPILFAVLFISCSNSETNELPEKIFFFSNVYGEFEGQSTNYKLCFRGNNVDIIFLSNQYHSSTKAIFKNDKFIVQSSEGCPPNGEEYCPAVGDSTYFVLDKKGLGVHNSEGGGYIYYSFDRSKSSHNLEEIYQNYIFSEKIMKFTGCECGAHSCILYFIDDAGIKHEFNERDNITSDENLDFGCPDAEKYKNKKFRIKYNLNKLNKEFKEEIIVSISLIKD